MVNIFYNFSTYGNIMNSSVYIHIFTIYAKITMCDQIERAINRPKNICSLKSAPPFVSRGAEPPENLA